MSAMYGTKKNVWNPGGGACPDMCETNTPDPVTFVVTLAAFTYTRGDARLVVYQDGVQVNPARITEIDESSYSIADYVVVTDDRVVTCVIAGVPVVP